MCLQTDLLAPDQNRSRKINTSCFHFRQVWRHLIRLLKLTIQAINIRFWIVGLDIIFFLPSPFKTGYLLIVFLVLQCRQACTCFRKKFFFYMLAEDFQLSLANYCSQLYYMYEKKIKIMNEFFQVSFSLWLKLWMGQLCFYSLWIFMTLLRLLC